MEYGTPAFIFAKLIGVPALFAVLLTISVSPILVWLYRRRLGEWMGQASGFAAGAGEQPHTDMLNTVVLDELAQPASGRHAKSTHPLSTRAAAQIKRAARAYGIAGLAHALVLTFAFALRHQSAISPTSLAAALVVFSLPAIMTVLHVVASSGWRRLGVMAAVLFALIIVVGDARGLATEVFNLHLLVPGSLFLIFNLRFWRGVAPMTMLVLAAGSAGWVVCAQIGGWFAEEGSALLWSLRLLGFAAGIWVGMKLLGLVAKNYEQRRLSDQALFLDAWWLLYTMVQTAIHVMTGGPAYVAVLLAFPVFLWVKRALLGRSAPLPPEPAKRLLLLRVFGFDRRTERFFDALSLRWRAVGTVELIAGRDLALRQIAPIDFAAFLTGKLASRFVRDPAAAATEMAERPFPDGRFPVRQFLCHADTWRPVMQELADRSDVVVMDLRGFTAEREGCRYELEALARLPPHKQVILVADRKTDFDALHGLLGSGVTATERCKERCARWTLVRAIRGRNAGHQVFDWIGERLSYGTAPPEVAHPMR